MKNTSFILLLTISIGFVACSKATDQNTASVGITVKLKSSSTPVTNAQIVVSKAMDSLYNFERHHADGTFSTCTSHQQHQSIMNGNTATFSNMTSDTSYFECSTRIGNCNYYGTLSMPIKTGMHQNITMLLDSSDASVNIKCRINGNGAFLQNVDVVFSTTNVGMSGHHGQNNSGGTYKGGYCMYGGTSNMSGMSQYVNLTPGYYYYDCTYGMMMGTNYSGHGRIEVKPGTHQEVIVDLK
ncbi:MAG: hypothetical protein ACOH2V_13605 [Candidatus Saccharimonadaceae bacterium]